LAVISFSKIEILFLMLDLSHETLVYFYCNTLFRLVGSIKSVHKPRTSLLIMQKVITKKKNYQIIEIKGILSILM